MTRANPGAPVAGPRVLLLIPARGYRAADFVIAAGRMGLDLVIGSDGALPLGGGPVIPVDPRYPDQAVRRILDRAGPIDAVVAADSPMLVLAAALADKLGLPHNSVEAVRDATDKARQRRRWAAAGVPQPRFAILSRPAGDGAVRAATAAVGFPCVVKAVSLSASQGILRADDPEGAVAAAARIGQILTAAGRGATEPLIVEEYLPGPELSIDALLSRGELTVTAVFDKPATPDGPTFEETLLVTPSELPAPVLADAVATAGRAARALGLETGPIHAELRITGTADGQRLPAMLELAARSIGGLCSRTLRFPGGATLEELILANALGQPTPASGQEHRRPSGVFMLPVPRAGVLRAIEGRERVLALPAVTGLNLTVAIGQRVFPLPDGDRYLGFIFAEGDGRDEVERSLTTAGRLLHAVID